MVAALLLLSAVVAVAVVLRRRRKAQLAGLDATRPVFSVEPPSRSVGKRKHEAL